MNRFGNSGIFRGDRKVCAVTVVVEGGVGAGTTTEGNEDGIRGTVVTEPGGVLEVGIMTGGTGAVGTAGTFPIGTLPTGTLPTGTAGTALGT